MTGILWLVPITPIAVSAIYPNTQRQHVTLAYGVERKDYENIIGLSASVGILEECWNDEVQTVSVVLQSWLPCNNLHPHITISWVDSSAPVMSNLMLQGEHYSKALDGSVLPCMVEFLEWTDPVDPHKWRDRSPAICKQPGCDKTTRSLTGYCRSHRPATKYR
ncbi:hypothetical protein H6F86_20900 [Phormidium sp. FACHB-592]|uniref:tRNA ligase phosphodiesterase domain-containing protein n=1 Tax=Stenomitos frigidus AS-A4 TaxID=2933935 RepID=A0ABV0KEN3_9CYAN|nr:hypothetical protein [Phormidium sp. FACHB-592]MBD2076293.1 hypothetical protein [Phormidium sp. FACHB-592]